MMKETEARGSLKADAIAALERLKQRQKPPDRSGYLKTPFQEGKINRKLFLTGVAAILGVGVVAAAVKTLGEGELVISAKATEEEDLVIPHPQLNYNEIFRIENRDWKSIYLSKRTDIPAPDGSTKPYEQLLIVPPNAPFGQRSEVVGANLMGNLDEFKPINSQLIKVGQEAYILARVYTAGHPDVSKGILRISNGGGGSNARIIDLTFQEQKVVVRYKKGSVDTHGYSIEQSVYEVKKNDPSVIKFTGGIYLREKGTQVQVALPSGQLTEPIHLPGSIFEPTGESSLMLQVGAGPRTTTVVNQLVLLRPKL